MDVFSNFFMKLRVLEDRLNDLKDHVEGQKLIEKATVIARSGAFTANVPGNGENAGYDSYVFSTERSEAFPDLFEASYKKVAGSGDEVLVQFKGMEVLKAEELVNDNNRTVLSTFTDTRAKKGIDPSDVKPYEVNRPLVSVGGMEHPFELITYKPGNGEWLKVLEDVYFRATTEVDNDNLRDLNELYSLD